MSAQTRACWASRFEIKKKKMEAGRARRPPISASARIRMVIAHLLFSLALAGRGPPTPSDKAATARWLVHEAQFVAQATISVALKGFPFNNVSIFSLPANDTHPA